MTRERAYERFIACVNLAERPGTESEGEVAREMAKKLADKYGFIFDSNAKVSKKAENEAKRAVRVWKTYTGKSKKDVKFILSLAASVGYNVEVDNLRMYVSNVELFAISTSLVKYQKASKAARHIYNKMLGLNGSSGFSNWYSWFKEATVKYTTSSMRSNYHSAEYRRVVEDLCEIKEMLQKYKEV